jgi:phosphoglycolate phosphatase
METYDSIIFDLDGTLWDASEACANAWNIALLTGLSVKPDDIRGVSGLLFLSRW